MRPYEQQRPNTNDREYNQNTPILSSQIVYLMYLDRMPVKFYK